MRGIWDLLKKDLQMMYAGKFFLLAFLSLVLYSCYINLVYVNINQEAIKRYLYDPSDRYIQNTSCIRVTDRAELEAACADRMSVGIDVSGDTPQIYMLSSGKDTVDRYRSIWAQAVLAEAAPHFKYSGVQESVQIIGQFDKAEKSRREMTAEVLFFELSAVGFLGLASVLFKEKQMGVLRLHGIMPVSKVAFILSKTGVFLGADLIFTVLLTMVNVGVGDSAAILPKLLPHAAGLSVFMTLTGFLCALWLSDFKQFSLFYLVIAIFVTTPVFLVEQSGIAWDWIVWHPMYHLFRAVKAAYFETAAAPPSYYIISAGVLVLLLAAVFGALSREMAAEG